MRDHGGDIDKAAGSFGGRDWIDLSTGINRRPWQAAPLSAHALTALPTRADSARLCAAAAGRFGSAIEEVLPMAGASAAMGAFAAGIVLAESESIADVSSTFAPFRDVLSSLFFISVGMLFDPEFLAHHPVLVVAGAAVYFLAAASQVRA